MTTIRLDQNRTGVADANGNAVLVLGPPPGYRTWIVGRTVVSALNSPSATAAIYRGLSAVPGALLGSSGGAQTDVSTDGYQLWPNEQITVFFANCTPGDQVAARIEGDDRPSYE